MGVFVRVLGTLLSGVQVFQIGGTVHIGGIDATNVTHSKCERCYKVTQKNITFQTLRSCKSIHTQNRPFRIASQIERSARYANLSTEVSVSANVCVCLCVCKRRIVCMLCVCV